MENNNKFKIICYSNGTKSLPNLNYKSRKFQIFDCHSEILTLRCFKFFLVNALYYYLDKDNTKNFLTKEENELFKSMGDFYNIFEYNQLNKKFKIKNGINFYLYISENPCGECSNIIYNINNQQNLKEMTGSKTIEECLNFINKNNKDNKILNNKKYYFRSKSIRSDFKINNLSFSLSCTDKIMLRNILGYQGKFLSILLEPIFIKGLIINNSMDAINDNIEKFKTCINYNKRQLYNKINIKAYQCSIPEIYFVNHRDENSAKNNNKNDKNALPFSTYWFFPNTFKKLDPTNGIKTGGNIKEIDKLDFLRVKISNYDLCENIINLLIDNKKNFKKYIQNIEKYILKGDIDNLDCYDLICSLINNDYIKIKNNIINENIEIKDFIGKKRNIMNNNK